MTKIANLFKSEEATTAVEYALLLAFIGALLLASIVAAGGVSGTIFGANADNINSVVK
jgi:Flp pilus assembly pilin Flp